MIVYISIFVLIFASGIFSASETAVTGSSSGKIQKLKSEGNKKAAKVIKLLKNKAGLISSLLVANNIVNILSTSIVTTIFVELYGDQGAAYATFIMSILIIIFAEVLPKNIAVAHPEKLAIFMAPFLSFLVNILTPINYLLNEIVAKVIVLLRINSGKSISGAEEVRGMIEHQLEEGNVFKSDRDMLGGVLDLSSIPISSVMTHRSHMRMINVELPIEEIIKEAINIPNTRIPLFKGDKDNVVGILHIRNLLKVLYDNKFDLKKIKLENFITQPWFIPENAIVGVQLNEFRSRKNHFAIVVDEYGNIVGLLTLKDIIEEIIGRIEDEFDANINYITRQGEGSYIILGSAVIRDINRELEWSLPDEEVNTIAGLIVHEMGKIPEIGEEIIISDLSFKVLKKNYNTIESVLVNIIS